MEQNPDTRAFITLCNVYCQAVENVDSLTPRKFVDGMLRVLPRIYIGAADIEPTLLPDNDDDPSLDSYLSENHYDELKRSIENLLGPDDIYLEVFEEDMRYSDTPISASISEGICDIFQVLYNFLYTVKDAPDELVDIAVIAIKQDFRIYWSQKLVNLLRPLNHLRYNTFEADENESE